MHGEWNEGYHRCVHLTFVGWYEMSVYQPLKNRIKAGH